MNETYVITRSFMENCYLDCFIKHYISLNFTKIIILKSDSRPYIIKPEYRNYVIIHNVKNEGNVIYNNNRHLYNNLKGWFLFVDIDEFLIIKKQYKSNINLLIDEIYNKNNSVNILFFRWLMIDKYNNNTNGINIQNIVKNYYKYSNDHVKCMVNSKNFTSITCPHYPEIDTKPVIYFENNFIIDNVAKHSLQNNSYINDNYIIHIHSRSITNIITKSLNSYNNMCKGKIINHKNEFIDYINNEKYNSSRKLLHDFKYLIGSKATLPFNNYNSKKIDIEFPQFNYDMNLIDLDSENKMLKEYCEINDINLNNILEFIKLFNKIGNLLFKKSNFDWKKYVNNYSDLKHINCHDDAIKHYINHGIIENRSYN